MSKATIRDHLFISYAWEDGAFAEWLALRLTAEGYKVWIDRFKLLGGEPWPQDIDTAIKTRAFRMLGILSRHSVAKPNPVKERTLALNLGKQPDRKGFLIPLNLDGLAPTELDWLSSDITFIPFAESWFKGLTQLLKLLERENCPRSATDGREIVARVASATLSEIVISEPEVLTSNVFRFVQVPTHLTTYIVEPSIEMGTGGWNDAGRDWAFYGTKPHRAVAFHSPGDDLAAWLHTEAVQTAEWRKIETVEGIDPLKLVLALLRRCIETRCRLHGLGWSSEAEGFYFQGPCNS